MKYLKIVGLAAIASMTLIMVTSGSSASATVLCMTTATPCGESWSYWPGSEVHASLDAGNSPTFRETGGALLAECTEAQLAFRTRTVARQR